MPTCAFISFRLGGIDGVSRVTANWQEIFKNLGLKTYTIAGEGTADFILPGLAIKAKRLPDKSELEKALASADLVIVENLCTIPLNLPASLAVADVLKGRPAIMHHHDPAWQRSEFTDIPELSIDDPSWLHVVINKITKKEMAERGITASCVYNPFKINPPTQKEFAKIREETRSLLKVEKDDLLIVHPTRAIPRKNIERAVEITEELGGTYWITGNTESFEKYDEDFNIIWESAKCRCIKKSVPDTAAIYVASDLVVYPSYWESFGLPPVEAAIYGRHTIVGNHPVAKELMSLGFKWFLESELAELQELLPNKNTPQTPENTQKSTAILENNFTVAKEHLSMEKIQAQIKELIKQLGF